MPDDALVIVTAVLVLVTLIYACFTWKLSRETQRERQTRWIEHKLLELYQPLSNLFRSAKEAVDLYNDMFQNHTYDRFYLASKELRTELWKLYDHFDTHKQTIIDEEKAMFERVKALVSSEIEEMTEKLEKLNS